MTRMKYSGLLGYAVMAMWLIHVLTAPAFAQPSAMTPTRLADHTDAIHAALVAEGAPIEANVSLSAPDAIIDVAADGAITIETVSYNRATGRFLIRARGTPDGALVAISGNALTPVTLPTPARDIERGEIITEDDIDFIEFSDRPVRQYLDDADLVIGKEARRPLTSGTPISATDLKSPIVIKRGASATIVLEAAGLRLTQVAIALENGAAGDLIAFRNVNSDAEIKASVVSETLARAPNAHSNDRRAINDAE